MSALVTLENAALRISINPNVGGTITAIEHRLLGLNVMGTVPWDPIDSPMEPAEARDELSWLTRFTGGWPLMFPNAGDACVFEGVEHGFHGEASITPWRAEVLSERSVSLTRSFVSVPVQMRRILTIDNEVLSIEETAEVMGDQPVQVMWGHHATFGSDLLDGDFEIQSGAGSVTADGVYDPASNPLLPGAVGRWPMSPGKTGLFDLSHPARADNIGALAYLHDFDTAWASIRRLDNAIAIALSWQAETFPCAWLWCELGCTTSAPWNGRARLIALEPNSTRLGYGLAEAARCGAQLLTLSPGQPVSTIIKLHVFKPSGAVVAVDHTGRAR